MAEKSTDAVREWTKNNLERRREMNRRAAKAFYARKKENDPEYMEKRREYYAVKMRKKYKPTSEMTEEELEKQKDEILSSKSWKMTKPIRSSFNLFK